ncbi:hypothetical protein BUE76_17255 [Cnuella takakiae]|nr:hypothetical protein BUE76_17255 [Cnuella takakiae]
MLPRSARADHITGGELYYTLMGTPGGNYQYNITVKVFMRCNSGRQFNNPAVISIFDKGNRNRIQDIEVRLARTTTLQLNDPNKCITDPPLVCYEVGFYEFTATLPPTPNGYIVASQFVFRIGGIRNLIPFYSNVGTTYMGEIPGTEVPGAPANSSARFTGNDLVAVCANNAFTYSFAATDADGDELRYAFCDAYQGGTFRMGAAEPVSTPPFQSVPYGNGFTGSAPLGDKVRIDSRTGLITGIAPSEGIYVVTVCVSEIRNGKVIATQRKDLQIFIASCTIAAATLEPEYNLCRDSTRLVVSNQSNSPLIRSYNWELQDRSGRQLAGSSEQGFAYDFRDTGLFNLKLVINRNGECADSNTSLVRVYPGFKPAFDFEGLCNGKPTRFRDGSTTVYGRINQWQWDFDDGIATSSDEQYNRPNTEYQYRSAGSRQVVMQVSNSNGCRDTATRLLAIIDKPALNLGFRDTTICISDGVRLQANGSGALRWSPLVEMVNPEAPDPEVRPTITRTYYADLDDNGCRNRDSVRIMVEREVQLVAMADTTICSGDSLRLRIASNALRYQWQAAPGLEQTDVSNPIARPVANSIYQLTASIGNCQATASITINTLPYPISNAGADTTICFGTEAFLQGSTNGQNFSWSNTQSLSNPQNLQSTARPAGTTAYILTATNNSGCPKPSRDTVIVTVRPLIRAFAGRDTSVVLGQSLQLQAAGGELYQWSPATALSATDIANPIARFNNNYGGGIRYQVKVYTPEGCADSASILVKIFATGPQVFVPTAFSPNQDGLNDLLRPIAVGISRVERFSVFNRWGQLLYNAPDGRGWDGTVGGQPQVAGVYVWMVQATDFQGRKMVQKGTATLIR